MRATRTVVLAVNPDVMGDVEKILRAGAMGISEPVGGDGERLRVHQFHEQNVPARVLPGLPPVEVAARTGMSARMLQTLQLLADGLPVKGIAGRMGIAPSSAQSHTLRLYRFLDVNSAPAAVAEGFRRGLLTGGES